MRWGSTRAQFGELNHTLGEATGLTQDPIGSSNPPWHRRNKKFVIVAVILSIIIAVPTVVYYELRLQLGERDPSGACH